MTISLAQLQILARERLPDKRHELLRTLADVFFESAPDWRPQERVLFDDILQKVFDELPFARQELAERLAARADAPRRVVVKLAGDTIAVAAPVLTRSPVLQDDDLAGLAREKSQDHLLAISNRSWVSERITDILVDRGDSLVLDSIAENVGAQFSQSGGAALVAKARKRETLWQRLAGRGDLADCIAYQMAPLADPMAAETSAPRLRAATALARPLEELMTFMAEGRLRLCDVLIELADSGRVFDLAQLICGRANVESHVFVRYLFAPNVEPLMKVCRAALMDLESFSAIMEPPAFPTSIVRSSPVRSQKQFASKIERHTSNVKAAFASHRPGRDGGSCRACHSSSTDCRRGLKNQCPDVHMHAHERAAAAARSPQPVFRIRSARDDFH